MPEDRHVFVGDRCRAVFPWMRLGWTEVSIDMRPNARVEADEILRETHRLVGENAALLIKKSETITDFYKALGSSRKSHIETLLRAAAAGKPFKPVHPMVDAILCAELETATLMGVHDAAKIEGAVSLDLPPDGDIFEGIGGKTVVPLGVDLVLRDRVGTWASYTLGPDKRTLVDGSSRDLFMFVFFNPAVTVAGSDEAIDLSLRNLSRIGRLSVHGRGVAGVR